MSEIVDGEIRIASGANVKSSLPTRAQVGWIIVLLAVLVIGLASFIAIRLAGLTLSATQKWEYEIVLPNDVIFNIELNKLGEQG